MPKSELHTPQEISKRIRDKVADLNDEFILAALAEVNVELFIEKMPEPADDTLHLRVLCSQEVR